MEFTILKNNDSSPRTWCRPGAARIAPFAVLCGITIVFTCAESGANGDSLVLVEDGRPRSAILVANNAGRSVRLAAQELQQYVQRASGARLRILRPAAAATLSDDTVRIVIGPGETARQLGLGTSNLQRESFRIKAAGNTLVFLGKDEEDHGTPTRWAVGEVLDRQLGVRWLWPGEVGTFVPQQRTITVPEMDVTIRPPLLQRKLRSRGSELTHEWLQRQRMGSRMPYQFGHSFMNWWDDYSKSHPDYFAVPPDGYRQPYPRPERVKLNLANPGVADQIIAEWRAAGRPDNWPVCPNDGSGFCTSDASRALDLPNIHDPIDIWKGRANLTRRYVLFWNGLIRRMKEENPRLKLSSYAYSAFREPPPDDLALEPGIVIGMVHSFTGRDAWLHWHEKGAELVLRPNWWHMGGSAPHMPLHVSGEFFQFCMQHSMIGFDFDAILGYWGTQGLNYYMIARLSVRPDLTVDDVINEYTSAFGKAAPQIRQYVDYWERFTTQAAYQVPAGGGVSQNSNGPYERLAREHNFSPHPLSGSWRVMPYLYTDEVMQAASDILDRARQATAEDPEIVRRRVQFLSDSLRLFDQQRELIRLAFKQTRRPGETKADLLQAIDDWNVLREQAVKKHGPLFPGPAISERIRSSVRDLEGT